MNSRKRRAQEPLLPYRQPKQRRMKSTGRDGGAPSPSENEGQLASWMRLSRAGLDAGWSFTKSVICYVVPVSWQTPNQTENALPDEISSPCSVSSPAPVSTPPQSPAPEVHIVSDESDGSQNDVRSRPKKPFVDSHSMRSLSKATPMHEMYSGMPIPWTDSSQKSTSRAASGSSSTKSSTNDTSLTSEPSTHTSVTSFQPTPKARLPKPTSSHPTPLLSNLDRESPGNVLTHRMDNLQLNATPTQQLPLQSSQISMTSSAFLREPTMQSTKSSKKPKRNAKRYRDRPHIYAKVHKASVQRQRLEMREEMKQELYGMRVRRGFTSTYSDFKGLLDYQRQLQNIDLENAPRPPYPSSSFKTGSLPVVKESEEEDAFLRRTILNAKATLNSPAPQKPFLASLEQLQIQHRAKDEALERRIRPPLPTSLPDTEDQEVKNVLRRKGVIAKFAREQVNDQDISRLLPGQWLNDEIINFYGAMLLARAEGSKENKGTGSEQADGKGAKGVKEPLNAYYFSSFFWTKLTTEGYETGRLAKWSKKVDLFSKDVVLIPVNHGNAHWTAAAINFRRKRFESYDSMGMAKSQVWRHLRAYIDAEHMNKKKKPFDFTGWQDWAPEDTPQQENGYDCGVFTCHFLEALSRGEETFAFAQKDMPYLRRRMIWEISHSHLRGGHYA